jgi:predicted porin
MTLTRACLLAASIAAATAAHAQTTATSSASDDSSLTWKGITLYGIVDVDFQYENHGAPFSNYFISGGSDIVQKNSNDQVSGLTSNGLSQSRVGLQGNEPLQFLDFSGVFKLETFFNPASGQITDALKSVTQNNGRPLTEQSTNIDSSIAGQPFQQAFVGISSPTYGTLTFGRQNSTLADLIAKYDPQQNSYAFSLLGLSGTPAGGGDTQDRRLDASIKYDAHFFDLVHFGAQYKTQGSSAASYPYGGTGEAFSAFEVALGAQYLGASIDAFYTKIRDAVSAGALSAVQVDDLASLHLSSQNSVAGTISDNASYGAMVSYSLGSLMPALPVSLYGGYQHITYMDPSIKLLVGFDDIGGYVLGAVNNTAYAKADKILQVYWGGVRYAIIPQLTATIAYYGEKQDAYATGKTAGCTTNVSGSCAGNFDAVSASLVYHFSKRFDAYAGVMYSSVSGGLSNGYLNNSMIDPTMGVRFTF